jgi:hypothetical protein
MSTYRLISSGADIAGIALAFVGLCALGRKIAAG